jgi:hypothetical protein
MDERLRATRRQAWMDPEDPVARARTFADAARSQTWTDEMLATIVHAARKRGDPAARADMMPDPSGRRVRAFPRRWGDGDTPAMVPTDWERCRCCAAYFRPAGGMGSPFVSLTVHVLSRVHVLELIRKDREKWAAWVREGGGL